MRYLKWRYVRYISLMSGIKRRYFRQELRGLLYARAFQLSAVCFKFNQNECYP
jgi:hypothetical protein